jgi:Zn-dependent protease
VDVLTTGQNCASCGARFPQGALVCPSCQKLVHTEALHRLAQEAQTAASARDVPGELNAWRRALELLPPASRQHAAILEKVQLLAAREPQAAHAKHGPSATLKAGLGGLTAIGLLLWKFKALGIFVLGKAKFLLLGLTKAPTLLSMLLSMGLYFTLWGWKFAVGFALSIYVHEMGHVAAMRRLGITASAPMFIPGFGAFVRGQQYPSSPAENARVSLAGPIWGLGAAVACALVYYATDIAIWGALAKSGAYINLFNLLPVFGLDGSHAFQALDKRARIIVAGTFLGAWIMSSEGLLILLVLVAGYRAFATPPAAETDTRTLYEFVGLTAALTFLMHMHVPV